MDLARVKIGRKIYFMGFNDLLILGEILNDFDTRDDIKEMIMEIRDSRQQQIEELMDQDFKKVPLIV
jgi:hypothetical protein